MHDRPTDLTSSLESLMFGRAAVVLLDCNLIIVININDNHAIIISLYSVLSSYYF